jgi:hypothetical protein
MPVSLTEISTEPSACLAGRGHVSLWRSMTALPFFFDRFLLNLRVRRDRQPVFF